MASASRILLADDQPEVLQALGLLLKGEGFETDCVSDPAELLRALDGGAFDLVLLDLNYADDDRSGREGLDLLQQIQSRQEPPPVVVMTAWGSVDLAVEAMRRGARDFVGKPWDNARLVAILKNQIALGRALGRRAALEAENRALREERPPVLIGQSEAMREVIELVSRIGPSEANVLITGENGTGKGVVARAIHRASPRAPRPLITVNIGGLSEGVFSSEVFGHEKGAFTDARSERVGRFELADGGTLFLDEIANLAAPLQAKLLRVVETGEFERVGSSRTRHADARILSATNADLAEEVAAGRFREDLLFRLNTFEIALPPLRKRRADVPALAAHFLARHAHRYRKSLAGFDDRALAALERHDFPGNLRELDHAIERAVLMAEGPRIRVVDLDLGRSDDRRAGLEAMSLDEVECLLIRKALDRHGGNVSQAARRLGISRSGLYRRLKSHGLA